MATAVNNDAILIAHLRMDGGTQSRALLDEEVVRDYASAMKEGAIFPPVSVIYDGKNYWLWDGFHRVHATQACGLEVIACVVEQGTQRDAILKSCGANPTHGLRRTNADKRRAVLTLLNDEEWQRWSDSEIARRCAVNQSTVSRIRNEYSLMQSIRTFTNKHGSVSEMDTTHIGKGGFKPAVPEDAPIHMSEAVDFGLAGPVQAVAYTDRIKQVSEWTHDVATRYGVLDVDTLEILERLYAQEADTCEEIEATGYIQPGEDYEAVHIASGAMAVLEALRLKSKVHASLGNDEKPQKLAECHIFVCGFNVDADTRQPIPDEIVIKLNPEDAKFLVETGGDPLQMIVREVAEA